MENKYTMTIGNVCTNCCTKYLFRMNYFPPDFSPLFVVRCIQFVQQLSSSEDWTQILFKGPNRDTVTAVCTRYLIKGVGHSSRQLPLDLDNTKSLAVANLDHSYVVWHS